MSKLGFKTLELNCGYAEDSHISCVLITWIGRIPNSYKSAKEMRDKFLSDFVDVWKEVYKPLPSLSLGTINELKNNGYKVPSNEVPSIQQVFLEYVNGTADSQRHIDDELRKRNWDSCLKRSGRVAVIVNVDGYFAWLGNGHRKEDIPDYCAEWYRTYTITL